MDKPNRLGLLSVAVLAAIVLVLPLVVKSSFAIDIFIRILLFSFLGVAWNLMGGYAKQLSLGHAAYFGLGAYTSTLMQVNYGISPWIGMLAGGVVAMLASLPIGWLCFRLRGPYFTIATIATAQALMLIFLKFRDFAWGAEGTTIPNLGNAPLMMQFEAKSAYYYVVLGLLAVGLAITYAIEKSWMGYYLVAIGEDEDAAEAIGVNAPSMKRNIYMISAFLTALGGTFYTQYIYFIDPATAFSFNISIEAALVSIVGGIGTLWGPVIGTILLETTSTLLQSWLGSSLGGLQLTVYSLILMAVILWRPTGLIGMVTEAYQRYLNRRPARVEASIMADALVIKGLSKRFGGLRAVQDVSFTIQENTTVALIGPNGAGKTTSFHLITGFHRPDSGSVLAYGREIVGLRPHDICAHGVARTFQVAKPFGAMTVLANVMTGAFLRDKNAAVARKKAREVIEFVGLAAREQTAAKDLTTIDQRRLEMARALATQPRLLLLDEVMAGLNPAEIDQAVGLIGKLSQRGLTIVIVEHVMRAIMAVARHIVVLDHGQKIAEGTPKEIVENPEVVRAYLGSYVHPPAAGEH